jgi:uncharacterized protein (DUF2267 family)
MHHDEFLRHIRQEFPYDVPAGIDAVVRTVLGTLRQHITDGEWADIRSTMPKDLAPSFPQ